MEFRAVPKETVMLNPRKAFEERRIRSEIRKDPLTGRTARICHFMELKWQKPDFDALVEGTERYCPLCPDKVLEVTPCFPEDLVPGGRLILDDLVLFPNIAPYDSLSAVATLGARHFLPLGDIRPERIVKGLTLALEFFRRVDSSGHPEARYHLVNWNYMPPAGSSLIHPHLQVFSSSDAPNLMREELEAARIHADQKGSNYWEDLVRIEETRGERFLGYIGRTAWMSSFAPMGVAGDVLAVVQGVASTLEMTDQDLADLASGLVRVMAAYDRMGIYSFNLNLFTGAKGDDHARVHLVFSPRTFFNQKLGATDIGALRNLYNETICMAFPEEINDLLRPGFQTGSAS